MAPRRVKKVVKKTTTKVVVESTVDVSMVAVGSNVIGDEEAGRAPTPTLTISKVDIDPVKKVAVAIDDKIPTPGSNLARGVAIQEVAAHPVRQRHEEESDQAATQHNVNNEELKESTNPTADSDSAKPQADHPPSPTTEDKQTTGTRAEVESKLGVLDQDQKDATYNEETTRNRSVRRTPKADVHTGDERKKSKRRRRRRSTGDIINEKGYNYKRYLYRVLKQVHPEQRVSAKAMEVLNGFMDDMYERLANEASRLCRYIDKKTLSSREIQAAVRLILPGELAKHAMAEGTRAVASYLSKRSR